jgi:hypothetical protein
MFRQDFTCPALLEDESEELSVRGYHPLRPCFPDRFRLSSYSPLAWSAFARHY